MVRHTPVLNHCPIRDDPCLGDHDHAVADEVKGVIDVLGLAGRGDDAVLTEAHILVDDGILDARVAADADRRFAFAPVPETR